MGRQYAVFGLGNFGKSVALSLERLGCEVLVVDKSMEKIQEISDEVSYAMRADIEEAEVMETIGARNLDCKSADRIAGKNFEKGRSRCNCLSGKRNGDSYCKRNRSDKFCGMD